MQYFDKKYEQLSIKELIEMDKQKSGKSSKKNKPKPMTDLTLHELCVELNVALPEKANYLIRKSGMHYTINVEEMLQLLDKNKSFTEAGMI